MYTQMKEQTKPQKALLANLSNTKIPYTDLKLIINKFIFKKLQKSWYDQIRNKLHYIQDTIGEWLAGYRRNRKKKWYSPDFVLATPTLSTHTS